MSGAPVGRAFDVTFNRGEANERVERFYIQPRVFSDFTLGRLKTVLIKRRREHRCNLIQDFSTFGKDLPKAAQEAFGKELVADAKADVDIDLQQVLGLFQSLDTEAIATVLVCTVDGIDSLEKAKQVMAAYGSMEELLGLINEVAEAEYDAEKNSSRQPEKASQS